jgi:hypothetical protein
MYKLYQAEDGQNLCVEPYALSQNLRESIDHYIHDDGISMLESLEPRIENKTCWQIGYWSYRSSISK